jgi:hypothetical protein
MILVDAKVHLETCSSNQIEVWTGIGSEMSRCSK